MKLVIITGASRGIGLATAKKFLAEGWQVIGTYLNTSIPINHENLSVIRFDQGNPESIIGVVAQIKKVGAGIDAPH